MTRLKRDLLISLHLMKKLVFIFPQKVDLFPSIWCNICDSEGNQRTPWSTICWRLGFLSTCLPLCYCCYITRTLRRTRRKTTLMKYFEGQNEDPLTSQAKHLKTTS